MITFSGTGEVNAPSPSDIVFMANAEIESSGNQLFDSFSGSIVSGVSGADGRVYDNSTFVAEDTYPTGQAEFVSAGCRFYFRTDVTDAMFRFRRISGSVNHVSLQRVAGGTLRVSDSANSVNYDSGTANIALDTWYYCTLYCRINDTLGEFTAKLFDASGTLIETLTQSGIDTLNSGNKAEITAWGGVSGDTYVDHCWTDVNGAFRGCGYVEILSPNAVGDLTQWSRGGTDTGNNWNQLNELPRDTTSFTFSTAADQYDLFNFTNRSVAGNLTGLQQLIYGRAVTAGTRVHRPVCKVAGVIYEHPGGDITYTSTSSRIDVLRWMNNPATGTPWTDSELNGAQFGSKSVTGDVLLEAMHLHALIDIES